MSWFSSFEVVSTLNGFFGLVALSFAWASAFMAGITLKKSGILVRRVSEICTFGTAFIATLLFITNAQLSNLTTEQQNNAKNKLDSTTTELGETKSTLQETKNELEAALREQKNLKRGVKKFYDFKGNLIQFSSTGISMKEGEETVAFKKISDLEQLRDYQSLKTLCEEQIKKTPGWLTPYFYLGVAQANMGDIANAIISFEHVVVNAPDDPPYAQAEKFLKRLRQ